MARGIVSTIILVVIASVAPLVPSRMLSGSGNPMRYADATGMDAYRGLTGNKQTRLQPITGSHLSSRRCRDLNRPLKECLQ